MNISVTFNPAAIAVPVESVVDCLSLGLGYITLADSDHDFEGHAYRPHQYDLEPLSVSMTANVIRAALSVEYHDDDGMQYVVPASDLLDDSNQVSCSIAVGTTGFS